MLLHKIFAAKLVLTTGALATGALVAGATLIAVGCATACAARRHRSGPGDTNRSDGPPGAASEPSVHDAPA